MNQTDDLAFEIAEPRRPKWRARVRQMRRLRADAVKGGIALEQLDGQLLPVREQLVDERRELRDEGVGPLRRKPLHAAESFSRVKVAVLAFGFSYGLPADLDLLFDVRFLRNPNYEPELQPLTGADAAAAAFIEQDPALQPFLSRLFSLLDFLLPRYAESGKTQLTIAFGCTGGRHRSVYVAHRVLAHLEGDPRWSTSLSTRDIER